MKKNGLTLKRTCTIVAVATGAARRAKAGGFDHAAVTLGSDVAESKRILDANLAGSAGTAGQRNEIAEMALTMNSTGAPHSQNPAATSAAPAPRRVLVADDDETIRSILLHAVRELGFAVVVAADGQSAIKMLRRAAFETLVTDIHMPEMDGLEVIRAARAIQPSLHIVAMSGGNSYGMNFLRAARQLGADVILPKPFEIARLAGVLRAAAPP